MRLVLDTNVVVSGLLWNGAPRHLLDLARQTHVTVVTCPELLDELSRVCIYPKFRQRILSSGIDIDYLLYHYICFAKNIHVSMPVPRICRDATDDIVLACAIAGNAEAIVTGDNDLLVMKRHHHIPIVQVSEAILKVSFKRGFP